MPYIDKQQDKSTEAVQTMFDSIAGRYDLANDILSFGLHRLWAKKSLQQLPDRSSAHCLDLCTGTGALLPILCTKYGRVTGVDFSSEMLALAKSKYKNLLQSNLELFEGDALNLSFPDNSFDVVTVAYGIRNFASLEKGLKEIRRVLKPDGQLLIIEFGRPVKLLRPFYDFYSRYLMPLIGALITGSKKPYEYLPETARTFPYGDRLCQLAEQQGLKVRSKSYFAGIVYSYFG